MSVTLAAILTAIGIPVWVFLCITAVYAALKWAARGDEWWRFPLSFTVFIHLCAAMLGGVVFLAAWGWVR